VRLQLANLRAVFESLKAEFQSQKANFESLKANFEIQKADYERQKTKAYFESHLKSQQTKTWFESQLGSLKALFQSQLKSQIAVIKSPQKFGPFSLKSAKSQLKEEGKQQLSPDTFSFLLCSEILTQPFVLVVIVFLFQITIYSLFAVNLIKPSDNLLGIPANLERNV
jgi:hypothetical protein